MILLFLVLSRPMASYSQDLLAGLSINSLLGLKSLVRAR
jgi:hypothetical protein